MDWIKFLIWAGITFILYGLIAAGLTAASTFANVVSITGLVMWVYISFKTNCLQKKIRKNEKDS